MAGEKRGLDNAFGRLAKRVHSGVIGALNSKVVMPIRISDDTFAEAEQYHDYDDQENDIPFYANVSKPMTQNKYSNVPLGGYKVCKSNGRVIYLPFDTTKTKKPVLTDLKRGQLLSTPIYKLLDQLDNERYIPETVIDNNVQIEGQMWVDKYKPVTYLDLLSDENTNIQIISWLKRWDKCVFNKVIPDKIKESVFGFDTDPLQRPDRKVRNVHTKHFRY